MGFRVQGSGFMVHGSGSRVQGSGFRVQGFGVGVDLAFRSTRASCPATLACTLALRVDGFRIFG